MKLVWNKHACGGWVALLPDGGSAHIIPRAFGGTHARLRVFKSVLQPYFFNHQFYPTVAKAKAALMEKLKSPAA
jgi:hypothetical protein